MLTKKITLLICFSIFLSLIPVCAESKEVIGWLEMIRIYPGDLKVRAKMDTGAKSSSINVYNLKKQMRGREAWVSFELKENTKKEKSNSIVLEKKVFRTVKIKRKGGGLEERPVVTMEVCLGGLHKLIEMNLMDRSNFHYQVLIGRTDLRNDFLIDPSATFTRKPLCKVSVTLD